MVDWVAIGSLAAIATVVVAFMQLKSSQKTKRHEANKSDFKPQKPIEIFYNIERGSANLGNFEILDVDYSNENREKFDDLQVFLKHLHFGILTLYNESDTLAHRVYCEFTMSGLREATIESVAKLGKAAVQLEVVGDAMRISIAEMPVGEIVKISCVGTGRVGWLIEPLNAAVIFERKHNV